MTTNHFTPSAINFARNFVGRFKSIQALSLLRYHKNRYWNFLRQSGFFPNLKWDTNISPNLKKEWSPLEIVYFIEMMGPRENEWNIIPLKLVSGLNQEDEKKMVNTTKQFVLKRNTYNKTAKGIALPSVAREDRPLNIKQLQKQFVELKNGVEENRNSEDFTHAFTSRSIKLYKTKKEKYLPASPLNVFSTKIELKDFVIPQEKQSLIRQNSFYISPKKNVPVSLQNFSFLQEHFHDHKKTTRQFSPIETVHRPIISQSQQPNRREYRDPNNPFRYQIRESLIPKISQLQSQQMDLSTVQDVRNFQFVKTQIDSEIDFKKIFSLQNSNPLRNVLLFNYFKDEFLKEVRFKKTTQRTTNSKIKRTKIENWKNKVLKQLPLKYKKIQSQGEMKNYDESNDMAQNKNEKHWIFPKESSERNSNNYLSKNKAGENILSPIFPESVKSDSKNERLNEKGSFAKRLRENVKKIIGMNFSIQQHEKQQSYSSISPFPPFKQEVLQYHLNKFTFHHVDHLNVSVNSDTNSPQSVIFSHQEMMYGVDKSALPTMDNKFNSFLSSETEKQKKWTNASWIRMFPILKFVKKIIRGTSHYENKIEKKLPVEITTENIPVIVPLIKNSEDLRYENTIYLNPSFSDFQENIGFKIPGVENKRMPLNFRDHHKSNSSVSQEDKVLEAKTKEKEIEIEQFFKAHVPEAFPDEFNIVPEKKASRISRGNPIVEQTIWDENDEEKIEMDPSEKQRLLIALSEKIWEHIKKKIR